ncbi:hypothetical protein K2173_025421 [Erythroxylum novogranatense]|uniref:DUF4378 domain-containing protein n=1 Tax=Erythroxylum novogranatense TaxID=1862640 RepID=A0AAV8UDW7_9ROSI|nr:hypothetical protein K2173_025421 [Erythroxylum novogranatense]
MAKKSQKRTARHGRDRSGCMWGIINMFDFRHGRTTQRLLSDKRPGNRHAAGASSRKNKTETVTNPKENCPEAPDVEETIIAADAGKPSVKKLIEEEMFIEQDSKEEMNNAQVEPKESNAEHGCHNRKNQKRRSRSRSRSCDLGIEDLHVDEKMQTEFSCLQKSEKQSKNGLLMEAIMEEFCHQIHKKSVSYVNHSQHDEVRCQLNQKNPDFEEKLVEAIKCLISQKLINEKNGTEEGNMNLSKELRDALQILSSDEIFLKLLQGPKSVMLKYIQGLSDAQTEKSKGSQRLKDENSELLVGSNMSEKDLCDLRQPDKIVHTKQHKFFRRRTRSLEKIPSEGNNSYQTTNTTVILKPGLTGLQNSEEESNTSSLSKPHLIIRNREGNERAGSYFSLTEIKRKLKHAMGKERQENSSADTSKKHTSECAAIRNSEKGSKDISGFNSTSKDHFFVEKIARPPNAVKKEKKASRPKEYETSRPHDIANNKQRASNIYVEARKHLSEMLSNGAGNEDFSSRQVPKTLGKILSLPDYTISPIPSPGRDWGQIHGIGQARLSSCDQFQKQERNTSHTSQISLNSETHSFVSDGITTSKEHSPTNADSSASNELVVDIEVENNLCSGENDIASEGEMDIVKTIDAASLKENDTVNSPERNSSFSTAYDEPPGTPEVCKETECHESTEQDSYEETQYSSSPSLSPRTSCPVTKQDGDLEHAAEVPDRPSPVSVLEPIFSEEDISPASIRSQPAELRLQPQRIQFGDDEPLATDQAISLKTCVEDKESIFEYVTEVLEVSGINGDEFYIRSCISDQLLDPSIFSEVQYFPNQLCCDKKLLFDCINEVLVEVYGYYLGCFPGLLLVKRTIRPFPDMKNAIREIWEGVYWHLLPFPPPHTLDQIVSKDLAKTGTWMDLQFDTETIVVDIVEAIFEDLTEEILCSCEDQSWESVDAITPAELMVTENTSHL